MEGLNDKSIKEILLDMGKLIRRFQEAYLQRKGIQYNEIVSDNVEPTNQEEEDQHFETSSDNLKRQDFGKQGKSGQENGKNGKFEEGTVHSGKTQQMQEDIDYLDYCDYTLGINDWKNRPGVETRARNQYYWGGRLENEMEDYIHFLRKKKEKRKKERERCYKITRKKKIERLRSRGWKIKIKELHKIV